MNDCSQLPESIRIKYCIKGDKHFRLYNCSKGDLNYEKLSNLVKDSSEKCLIKICVLNTITKDEKVINSFDEFNRFLGSNEFFSFYDSKYNCLKIQFSKEICVEKFDDRKKEFINDKNSTITLNFLLKTFEQSETACKNLHSFLKEKKLIPDEISEENYKLLLSHILTNIKENHQNIIDSKSSFGKINFDVSLHNLEDTNNEENCNFASIYNIEEMNSIPNEELIRDSTVFRTKKF